MKVSFKFTLFILFILVANGLSQDQDNRHQNIRKSVEQKDYITAIKNLKQLQKDSAKIFTANNYDYLLARLSEKQNDFATATSSYQAVVNRNSVLKEYALWHLSQIMRSTGNLMMERLYLQELSITSDTSLLKDALSKRFARSHLESGNFGIAIKLLNGKALAIAKKTDGTKTTVEKFSDALPGFNKDSPREDLVLLGEAYLKNGQTDKAKEIYNELVNNFPKANRPDDYALAGVKGLDKLEIGEDNFGKSAPNLSVDEHFKRATIYQFNRNFALARVHYEAIKKNYSQSPKAPVAVYQIARGYGQERNEEKVVEWAETLQKDYPENDLKDAAVYQAAGAYANLGNTTESVKRYIKYIDENPEADNVERAHLNIIDAYRDEKNHKTALKWTAKAQEAFKNEMGEAVALFSQIRIHISQGNWQNALNDLNRLKDMKNLGGIRIAGGTNKNEVTFLRGFVLEKLGRIDEAVDVYLSLDEGLTNYYGWRATKRLKGIEKSNGISNIAKASVNKRDLESKNLRLTPSLKKPSKEYGRKEIWQVPQKIKSHLTIADELLFLGLYDEGTPELELALRENLTKETGSLTDFPADTAYSLSVLYKRGDNAKRAISHIEPKWKKMPKDYPIEMIGRETLELLYPKPYEESLVKYGKEYKVDPRFVLSIMRQESRFQANVKSFAAARGLMQFISNTSDKMAEEMKLDSFRQDDLYNPPTAIRFGSHYINKIFRDFPSQPPAVAASYNGGEDRMMRWFKRANSDNPDRYVPEVIFSQTKDYVYKVMTNYRIYQMLYDENLKDKKTN